MRRKNTEHVKCAHVIDMRVTCDTFSHPTPNKNKIPETVTGAFSESLSDT
jgi:hypothetical protein